MSATERFVPESDAAGIRREKARARVQTGVDTLGLTDGVTKPVVMGEFGAFRFAYPDAEAGSAALVQWQEESCAFGFDGWMVWLWARTDDEVFGAREDHDAIARALSPEQRPDPCAAP